MMLTMYWIIHGQVVHKLRAMVSWEATELS